MNLAFSIGDIVQVPFGYLISWLYQFTTNYGLALIIFAILVKFILLPATAKAKKSSMKMSRLTPRVQAIQEKYANDKQKQNEAVQALYKEEGVSMGSGCLWSMLPLLILFPLYAVVRQPITYMLHETAEVAEKIVEVIKGADGSLFSNNAYYDQMIAASQIPNFLDQVKEALPNLSEATLKGINFNFLGIDLGAVPQWKVWTWQITADKGLWAHIGALLIPLLSAASQMVSMLLSRKMNNSLVTDEKGLQDNETAKKSQTNQQMGMMMWMMPLMSLWIGFTVPSALSLYWLIQGVVTTVIDVVLTRKYRKLYDAEDAARLQRALEEEALEAEKERIRAERRAANPEGITTNTSKKKLQQQQQREAEAAKKEAAKEYAVKKGEIAAEEEAEPATLSGVTDRPYCKGRAYDPNRYAADHTEE